MFTFTLLTPPDGSESCKASLLTIDDLTILADPTWNGKNHNDINFLESYLEDVNVIILSHSTPEFISGFMLLCIKYPHLMNDIKIYSSSAVSQLGKVSTVEFYRSLGIIGPLKDALLEISDVDEWFDKINGLKYYETTNVMEKSVITPYNSGHTLGGTFWLIQKKLEKIIYAPSWNHSKDSFLNGAGFLSSSTGNPISQLMRPTALITGSDLGSNISHKKRVAKFLQLVDATLNNGGTVLLPTSISGRFLELLHIIDSHLKSAPIPVLFLSYSGTNVLRYATNLLEWMSSQLSKELESANSMNPNSNSRSHYPFDPSKVDLVGNTYELTQLNGPKVVFTSGVDIKSGELSSEALRYLCQDENTSIILTEKAHFGSDDTINSQLYNEWYELCKSKNDDKVEDGVAVSLEKVINLKEWSLEEELVGGELNEYREKVNFKRKQKLLEQVRDRQSKNLLTGENFDGESSSDDDDDDDDDMEEDGIEANGVTKENGEAMEDVNTNGDAEPANETNNNSTVNGIAHEEVKATVNLMDDAATQEALVAENIKNSFDQNLPLDIKITSKLRARNAMFPFFSNKDKQDFDDYGAIINISDFERKDETNNQLGLEPKVDDRRNWGANKDDDTDMMNNQSKLTPQEMLNNEIIKKNLDSLFQPRKRIPVTPNSNIMGADPLKLTIKCNLSYVDLSGLVDLRSFSLIVSSLKPSNLLLLPDTTSFNDDDNGIKRIKDLLEQKANANEVDSKEHLVKSAQYLSIQTIRTGNLTNKASKLEIKEVISNDKIKIGSDEDSVNYGDFEVKLDESISKDLQWQTIDGSYRVAQIIGQLEVQSNKVDDGAKYSKKRKINQIVNQSSEFTLKKFNIDQLDSSKSLAGGSKLAIGNVRLPELKKRLQEKNLNAEFKGEGTLVVNDLISVRKVTYGNGDIDDTGDIVIHGQFGPLYYQIKECIRDMLAYV